MSTILTFNWIRLIKFNQFEPIIFINLLIVFFLYCYQCTWDPIYHHHGLNLPNPWRCTFLAPPSWIFKIKTMDFICADLYPNLCSNPWDSMSISNWRCCGNNNTPTTIFLIFNHVIHLCYISVDFSRIWTFVQWFLILY